MKSENLKNEFKKMRVSKIDIAINKVNNIEDFVQQIKNQDRSDEKY